MKKWFCITILTLGMALAPQPALGQGNEAHGKKEGAKDFPGYVEFDLSDEMGGKKPNVTVNLEGPLIRMAFAATATVESPLAMLLERLHLIQVKVYEDIGEFYSKTRPIAESKIAKLKEEGWTTAVSVPDGADTVDVMVKSNDDIIFGLMVLVMEEDELVFVNLAGEIEPEVMGQFLGSLGAGVFTGDIDFEDLLFAGQEEYEEEIEEEEFGRDDESEN